MRSPFFICFVAISSLGAAVPQQTANPPQPNKGSTNSMAPMMPMAIVAPLFIQDTTTESVISAVSDLSTPLDVDVVLYDLAGNQISKRTVTMAPYSQQNIKIADLLSTAAVLSPATYGSVSLMTAKPAPLAAQLSITSSTGSAVNDIEEEFVMFMNTKPANYRAVTSGLSAMPIVAIHSLSMMRQSVTLTCYLQSGAGRTSSMPIEPNQTLLLQACRGTGVSPIATLADALPEMLDSKLAVGIAVSSSAPANELAVFGLGAHDRGHSYSAVAFWDPAMLKSANAIYPGVPLAENPIFGPQTFNLRASLANFSATPHNATILLSKGTGADSTQKVIATLTVPAHSVVVKDLPEAAAEASSTNSLIVQAGGTAGDVLSDVQAVSEDSGSPESTTLPWKDQEQFANKGQHPWNIEGSTTSTVLIFNPDPALANRFVQLAIHAGQTAWIKKVSLPPLATVAISINDIITKQQPDDKGNKLPPDAKSGSVTWTTLNKPKVFGKLVQLDELTGLSRTFSCYSGQALCQLSMLDLFIETGATYNEYAPVVSCGTDAYECGCISSCDWGGLSPTSVSAWMGNNSVASVTSSGIDNTGTPWAAAQGNAFGETYLSMTATDANGCVAGDSAQTEVGPDHMVVQSDLIGFCTGCSTTMERDVTYNVQYPDPDDTPAKNIKICETIKEPNPSDWNCNQPEPGTKTNVCVVDDSTTDSSGNFTDGWTLGADGYTPAGCGHSLTDKWLQDVSNNVQVPFGTLMGFIHTNAIKINGTTTPPQTNSMRPGTRINP